VKAVGFRQYDALSNTEYIIIGLLTLHRSAEARPCHDLVFSLSAASACPDPAVAPIRAKNSEPGHRSPNGVDWTGGETDRPGWGLQGWGSCDVRTGMCR
jgi:hypothetical protein